MFSKVLSADVRGIEGYAVQVEADISDGMPMFIMVGYLASEVKEAGDRVRTALRNSGISLPAKRITINLAPAGIRKAGSKFDLPIAVAILSALGYIPPEELKDLLIVGELSLNGEILGVHGILPIVEAAKEFGCKCCIVPKVNASEGAVIRGINVIGVEHLEELLTCLLRINQVAPVHVKIETLFENAQEAYDVDFSEINGQEAVKRSAEVAVAGMHNLLMIGPPGSGKTMVAKRIPTILPPLTLEESLEISKIYSIAGMLPEAVPLILKRPFRSPHHTISPSALVGGGKNPMPGEVSLSSRGVLFIDEFPEMNRAALEVMRQPLEDREVQITRVAGTYVYPAHFMLVAAMNPCNCGHYPDMNLCSCSTRDVNRYLDKISQPLLDRIDICTEAPRIEYADLTQASQNETSKEIRERVINAQQIQQERYKGTGIQFNSDLSGKGIEEYCPLGKKEKQLLEDAFHKLNLSARAYHKIIKVARTIADLEESGVIESKHVLESICYRSVDKRYWMR